MTPVQLSKLFTNHAKGAEDSHINLVSIINRNADNRFRIPQGIRQEFFSSPTGAMGCMSELFLALNSC
jgi:hypothetical protein